MIIDRALFRNGANEEIVTLESITHHENYINVKENLYCIMPNVSRLSEEHVKKVLKETFDKFNETNEERIKRLEKQNQKARNRKNKIVEPQGKLDFEDIVVHLPTTSLDANEVREGERNPTVKKRISILDFVFVDIGLTMSTVGFLKEIVINEKYSTITLTDDYERLTFTLFLEEAFYVNSHLNINPMFEGLNKLYSSGEEIVVTCIGEVVLREGQLGMLIMDEEKLSFNSLPLSSLLLSKNTLF